VALAPSRRDATGRERPRRRTFTAKESSVPLDGSPALIYLHATRERDQRIAAGMGQLFQGRHGSAAGWHQVPYTGTQRARGWERDC